MQHLDILKRLNELFGEEMTLQQAFCTLDQIELTIDALEEEGLEFEMDTLILDMGRFILFENN